MPSCCSRFRAPLQRRSNTFDPGHGVTKSWCLTRCAEHSTQRVPDGMHVSIHRVLQYCSGAILMRHQNKVMNSYRAAVWKPNKQMLI